jgi:hypothetical protein
MVYNRTDEIVAELERDWPDWQIWVIYPALGGAIWCARRWDDESVVLNTANPETLVDLLEEEASR